MQRHTPGRSRALAVEGPLRQGEAGFAIAAVVVLGFCLMLLSALVVLRGMRAVGNTSGDARWERALPTAESGVEVGLQALELPWGSPPVAGTFNTGESYPGSFASPEAERAWVVAAADAAPAGRVVGTPVGEYVVVKPATVNLLYAVGYSPSRAAFGRRTRVVRIGYELHEVGWKTEWALLVGDDLKLGGNSTVIDPTGHNGAGVHANGVVDTWGSWTVQGCLNSSVSSRPAAAHCPGSPVALEPVPDVDPLLMYHFAQVVLCPDGKAYAGPAAAVTPDLDGVPCNGGAEVGLAGWSSKVQSGVRDWDPKNVSQGGVYYVHAANVDGKVGGSASVKMTLLISAGGKTCAGSSTGSLSLAGNSFFGTAPSVLAAGYDIAVVAQGDVYYRGGATVQGAILAHEQIDYKGNADSYGPVVAESFCDTPGSPVSGSVMWSVLSGNASISYPGPVMTPFVSLRLESELISWYEL